MYKMTNSNSMLFCGVFISLICLKPNYCAPSTSCDLKMWYMEMLAEGAFDNEEGLSRQQSKIKGTVEKMVGREGDVMVPCAILSAYRTILLPLIDIPSLDGAEDHKEELPNQNKELVDTKEEVDSTDKLEKKPDRDEEPADIKLDQEEVKEVNIAENDKEKDENDNENITKELGDSQNVFDQEQEAIPNAENITSNNNISQEVYYKDRTTVKQWVKCVFMSYSTLHPFELFEQKGGIGSFFRSIPAMFGKVFGDSAKKEPVEDDAEKESAEIKPQDSVMENSQKVDMPKDNAEEAEEQLSFAELEKECEAIADEETFMLCYYLCILRSRCIQFYEFKEIPKKAIEESEELIPVEEKQPLTPDGDTKTPDSSDSENEEKKEEEGETGKTILDEAGDVIDIVSHEQPENEVREEKEVKKQKDVKEDIEDNAEEPEKIVDNVVVPEGEIEVGLGEKDDKDNAEEQEKIVGDIVSEGEVDEGEKENDQKDEKEEGKEQTEEPEKTTNSKEKEKEPVVDETKHFHHVPNVDYTKIQEILNAKGSEYVQKIQLLELQILKLENKLLTDTLHKSNSSATFSKLENQILKLENELLKINQSFSAVNKENEHLWKSQKSYVSDLEIFVKKQEICKSQQNMLDTKPAIEGVISKQQSQIEKLGNMVEKQNIYIKMLEEKANKFDLQNKVLEDAVYNQTLTMASIMKTLQNVTKEQQLYKDILEMTVQTKTSLDTSPPDVKTDRKAEEINEDLLIKDTRTDLDVPLDGAKQSGKDNKDEEKGMEITDEQKEFKENDEKENSPKQDSQKQTPGRAIEEDNGEVLEKKNSDDQEQEEKLDDIDELQQALENVGDIDKNQETGEVKAQEEKKQNEEMADIEELQKVMENLEDNGEPQEKPKKKKKKGLLKKSKKKKKKTKKAKKEISEDKKENNEDKIQHEVDEEKQNTQKELKKEELKEEEIKENIDSSKNSENKPSSEEDVKQQNEDKVKEEEVKKEVKQEVVEEVKQPEKVKVEEVKQKPVPIEKPKPKEKPKVVEKPKPKPKPKPKAKKKVVLPEILYTDPKQTEPKDCYDQFLQGRKRDTIMKIKLIGKNSPIDVFCDMKNGGWTVIQKREDGREDFFRDWDDYKTGFGNMYGDYWLGNDNIHLLTNQGHYTLRIEMMDWDRKTEWAEYDYFMIDKEKANYRLHIRGYNGTAGDSFTKHNLHQFSTKDKDNDTCPQKTFGGSCAKRFTGAWWYYNCYKSNLNGRYYKGGDVPGENYDGVAWKAWKGSKYSLKKVVMKLKPREV